MAAASDLERPGPPPEVATMQPPRFGARDAVDILPLALAVAVVVVFAALDGAYEPSRFLAGGLFILGLLVAVAVGARPQFGRRRSLAIAIPLLAAYTAWAYLSISWAAVKGDAWDGANRTLLYFCVFALFAWRPISTAVGTTLLGALSAAVAAVGAVDFVRIGHGLPVDGAFIAGRLSEPISYPNSNAALFLASFVPAIWIASLRGAPILARGVMLAAAGVLIELATMCQSRASLAALPITLVVFLVLCPSRLRALLALAAVAVPLALGARRLLDVYTAVFYSRHRAHALADARSVLLWTAVALFLFGAAVAVVDRRLTLSQRTVKAIGAVVGAALVAGVVVGTVAFVHRYGSPIERASSAWHDLTTDQPVKSNEIHLVSGFGTQRYDLWRVAADEFKRHPLEGVGIDNFAVDYLRERRTLIESTSPQSFEARLLAQTGLVGTVLFVAFLVAVLVAAAQSFRGRGRTTAGLAAASLSAVAYWLLHGSVEALWEVPVLGASAFAALAIAARATPRRASVPPVRPRARVALPFLAVALVAACSLGFPWVAAREVDAGVAGWRTDSAESFRRLGLARRLNPLSDAADVAAGVIAGRLHDARRERRAFLRALTRNPSNWYPQVELAALDSRQGRKAAALDRLRIAARLNPRETLIGDVRTKIAAGDAVTERDIRDVLLPRILIMTGKRQR